MTTMVRNAWYVGAWSTEVDQTLRRFTLLDENILFYRRLDGTCVALEDRCPHRMLPLSMGRRIGDDVQCGYHGLRFNGEGQCVRVPGQHKVPPSAFVRRFPVSERNGMIWIWMGDAELADESKIFHLPQFDDPKWHAHHGGALHIKSNYLNVAENLVDPAHVSFVHPTTLGNSSSENVPVHVSTEGEAIIAWRWIRDAEPIGFFKAFGNFTGNVDRWQYYYLYSPSTAVIDFGSAPTEWNMPEEERDRGTRVFALHFITPVNEDYSIDRWMHVRNTATDVGEASDRIDDLLKIAFAEDVAILEAVHAEEQRPQTRKPIRIAIDRGPMVYRKRIGEMLERERTQDVSAEGTGAYVYHD